jgi:hypothetical protein
MYIIRATQKLLNTSRKKPSPEDSRDLPTNFEWHAHIISTTFRGKLAVIYVHSVTKLAIIIPGKTIQYTSLILPGRIDALLSRHGIDQDIKSKLIPQGEPIILKTNNKSVLGYINEFNLALNHWFCEYSSYESINYNWLEDHLIGYLLSAKENYTTPLKLLKKL